MPKLARQLCTIEERDAKIVVVRSSREMTSVGLHCPPGDQVFHQPRAVAQFAAIELAQASVAQEFQQLGFDQFRLDRIMKLWLGELNQPLELLRRDGC